MPAPRRSTALRWLLLAAAVACLLFLALGAWQLQRMGWKHDLIARTEARIHAAPVPPPAATEWPAVVADPQAWEYRRLRLEGVFLHDREALVQATTVLGAGHWVLTPLRLADGSTVLVNRGFVPPERKDLAARGAPPPQGPVAVTGLLRISEPGGGFLRSNDPAAGRWYSRDVAAIATARGLQQGMAPYFLDAQATGAADAWPRAGLTVLRFADNHLVYALTWFGMAALSVVAAVQLLRHGRGVPRRPDEHEAAA